MSTFSHLPLPELKARIDRLEYLIDQQGSPTLQLRRELEEMKQAYEQRIAAAQSK